MTTEKEGKKEEMEGERKLLRSTVMEVEDYEEKEDRKDREDRELDEEIEDREDKKIKKEKEGKKENISSDLNCFVCGRDLVATKKGWTCSDDECNSHEGGS